MWRDTATVDSVEVEFRPLLTARQQPVWRDVRGLNRVRGELLGRPGLVTAEDTARLRWLLGRVVTGDHRVLQAGDCAEDPAECTPHGVRARTAVLDTLAETMSARTGHHVVRVGRMAGQFAKPRSSPTDRVGDLELPAYRGPMVNAPEADPVAREPDPGRLLTGYDLSRTVHSALAEHGRDPASAPRTAIWTSHEALLLDYELPLLRRLDDGGVLLASTHLPWIGERTRQVDGAHVHLLARVVNPVACKVGPTMAVDELLALCEVLDPDRQPGRLTLIARMGFGTVRRTLPNLVRAVRAAGHPVIWLCDPMHGNTVRAADGRKTRVVVSVIREVEGFQDAVLAERGVAGGLHLEATAQPVAECVRTAGQEPGTPYTTLCDPRLNLTQADEVVRAWHA